jgi:uncharacterized membrane protein YphA (DoxX/SURF4 family)
MASTLVLRIGVNVLTAMIMFVFLMSGLNKLTPALDAKTHDFLIEASVPYPAVFGLDKLGVGHKTLLAAIGAAEVALAVLMITNGALLAAFMLLLIMIGAVYTHVSLGESPVVPAVIGGIISVFLVLQSSLDSARGRVDLAASATNKKQ